MKKAMRQERLADFRSENALSSGRLLDTAPHQNALFVNEDYVEVAMSPRRCL